MVKRSGNEQNTAKGESQFDREGHHVLENIKTGKIASSNNWLNTLAAIVVMEGEPSGITTVLPLDKAQRLLQRNKVVEKKPRFKNNNSREQAKKMIPSLAALHGENLPNHKPPRINEFCKWAVRELQDPQSKIRKVAISKGFHDLIEARYTARWWQDQLKKMQS